MITRRAVESGGVTSRSVSGRLGFASTARRVIIRRLLAR